MIRVKKISNTTLIRKLSIYRGHDEKSLSGSGRCGDSLIFDIKFGQS